MLLFPFSFRLFLSPCVSVRCRLSLPSSSFPQYLPLIFPFPFCLPVFGHAGSLLHSVDLCLSVCCFCLLTCISVFRLSVCLLLVVAFPLSRCSAASVGLCVRRPALHAFSAFVRHKVNTCATIIYSTIMLSGVLFDAFSGNTLRSAVC